MTDHPTTTDYEWEAPETLAAHGNALADAAHDVALQWPSGAALDAAIDAWKNR